MLTRTNAFYLEVNDSWAIQEPEKATELLRQWEATHPRDTWDHSVDNSSPAFTVYRVSRKL